MQAAGAPVPEMPTVDPAHLADQLWSMHTTMRQQETIYPARSEQLQNAILVGAQLVNHEYNSAIFTTSFMETAEIAQPSLVEMLLR
jgi:hypothetical protein